MRVSLVQRWQWKVRQGSGIVDVLPTRLWTRRRDPGENPCGRGPTSIGWKPRRSRYTQEPGLSYFSPRPSARAGYHPNPALTTPRSFIGMHDAVAEVLLPLPGRRTTKETFSSITA